ncbi:NAD(P)-binding protein [Panus rudis PR-1116 ss-1]|nr:NAD(P)-binding protein [Panus rudis PR-1116 ss-1]
MSAGQLVLVTGVTGFLGGHIARELFAHGYRVRAIARSAKAPLLKEVYAPFGNKFEVVVEDDLVRGDLTEAVKGVDAVIHAAAPLPSRINSATEALEVAIEGSLNMIRQAERAGVKNFAYVSSAVALNFGDAPPLTDQSWRPVTKEEALKKTDKWDIYVAEICR